MTQAAPFAVDGPLAPPLARLLAYWEGLRRGQAEIPFWDDLSEVKIEASGAETFILDVFSRPERFRFNDLEVAPPAADRDQLLGLFLDDADLPEVFTLLRAQASAATELMRPTLYRAGGLQRLLLPAWGEGQVRMLVGGLARSGEQQALQAAATELMRPTLYRAGGLQRLLLPAWGEGQVRMLVGGLARS